MCLWLKGIFETEKERKYFRFGEHFGKVSVLCFRLDALIHLGIPKRQPAQRASQQERVDGCPPRKTLQQRDVLLYTIKMVALEPHDHYTKETGQGRAHEHPRGAITYKSCEGTTC